MPVSRRRKPKPRPAAAPSGMDRRTLLWLGGGAAALAAGVGAVAWWQAPTAPARPPGAAQDDFLAPTDLDLRAGAAEGPTLVEYGSLTCPACAAFAVQIWPEVERRLVRPGRLRFLYRDFPLDPVALAAAVMVRALPEEARLPAVKTLYAQQQAWVPTRPLQPQEIRRWVADRAGPLVGLSGSAAFAATGDGGWERRILGLRLDGQRAGVERTPTFLLPNRERFVGLRPPAEFAAMVEAARPGG